MNNDKQITQYSSNPVIISTPEQAAQAFSVANLIMHPYAMERVERYAQKMAQSKNMLPQCFHNDTSACEALIIQAASLGMNPEAIGRHAFKAPNGTINFEAKVFQAIAEIGAGVEFEEEYFGNWAQIINSSAQRNKQSLPDEAGVGIKLTGTWYKNGEKKTKTLEVYMAQCMPRLSVNWNNDPQLQTYYAAIKKFMRRYLPAAIMGIFDNDDMDTQHGTRQEKDVTPTKKQEDDLASIIGGEEIIDHEQASVDDSIIDNGGDFEEFTPPSKTEEIAQRIKETESLADLSKIAAELGKHQKDKTLTRGELVELNEIYVTRRTELNKQNDESTNSN